MTCKKPILNKEILLLLLSGQLNLSQSTVKPYCT